MGYGAIVLVSNLICGGTGFYHPANVAERMALSTVARGGFESSFEHSSGYSAIAIISYVIRRGTNEGLFNIVRGAIDLPRTQFVQIV